MALVERDELASGSTARAAGGVRAQFSDELNIRLGARSLEAFARFEEETGHDIGLHRVGYVFLLSRPHWIPRPYDAMERRAPALLDVRRTGGRAGLYEITPDHNALIGESGQISRFRYTTGFSGHGFLQGPAVGEVVRDLYLGHDPFVDITPLRAERFAADAPRPEVNLV